MFIRSNYNYDRNEASDASGLVCSEPTLAQQHFKEQCDINRMVAQYAKTGLINATTRIPLSDDFVGITDYHTSMNAIKAADEAFNALPARVREHFDNDPGTFVEFCLDPANLDQARELGLAVPAMPENPPSPVAESEAQLTPT